MSFINTWSGAAAALFKSNLQRFGIVALLELVAKLIGKVLVGIWMAKFFYRLWIMGLKLWFTAVVCLVFF